MRRIFKYKKEPNGTFGDEKTVLRIKHIVDGINNRLNTTKEQINEFGVLATETIQ